MANARAHSSSALDTRKRTRTLLIIATLSLLGLLLHSLSSTGVSKASSSRRLTTAGKREVSLKDSKKALEQLESIKEDEKSATKDATAAHVKNDPVSVKSAATTTSSGSVKKTATIITCPACRLNALPDVKRFVYEIATHFKPDLNVIYISGKDPTLHLYENAKETEKIPLHVCIYF